MYFLLRTHKPTAVRKSSPTRTISAASCWIDESSVTGRLLFTLVGYEATPTAIELQFYIAAVFGILFATGLTRYFIKRNTQISSFELERDFENNSGEFYTGLLIEKEWGRLAGALNLYVGYEWRDDLDDETETRSAFQLRYRYSQKIEPAIEFYQNHDTLAVGPALTGDVRLGVAKKLHWEFGVIFGLIDKTPAQTIRAMLEYEF